MKKLKGRQFAVKYLSDAGRSALRIPIAAVREGREPKAFWDAFEGKVELPRERIIRAQKAKRRAFKMAAQREKAWAGAGQKEGIQIWVIRRGVVEHWPKEVYGSFYSKELN